MVHRSLGWEVQMVLAIFTTICLLAVLFLLRFLTAMHVESKHTSGAVEHISRERFHPGPRVRDVAQVFTMVRGSSPQQIAYHRANSAQPIVARGRGSQF